MFEARRDDLNLYGGVCAHRYMRLSNRVVDYYFPDRFVCVGELRRWYRCWHIQTRCSAHQPISSIARLLVTRPNSSLLGVFSCAVLACVLQL